MKKRSGKKKATPHHSSITRGLNPEDALLWHRVTETLTPIGKRAQNRAVSLRDELLNEVNTEIIQPALRIAKKSPVKMASSASENMQRQPINPAPLNNIEKRLNRRIAKGNTQFDARIDLHGMTQAEAHDRLLQFLRVSQANGCRVALVITGKGRAEDSRDHFSMHEAPGVLRRNIRGWLEQVEFRNLVSAYAQAHRRHGGEGAIYVQLRRIKV